MDLTEWDLLELEIFDIFNEFQRKPSLKQN